MQLQYGSARGHDVLDLSVRLSIHTFVRWFIHYQICVHDILKMNEPTLLQIVTSGQRRKAKGQGHTMPNVKVTRCQSHISGAIMLDPFGCVGHLVLFTFSYFVGTTVSQVGRRCHHTFCAWLFLRLVMLTFGFRMLYYAGLYLPWITCVPTRHPVYMKYEVSTAFHS